MSKLKMMVVLLLVAAFGACATMTPDLPSITESPTGNRMSGKIVWHDLLTNTPAESRKFYEDLFGWKFEKPGIDIGFGEESSYMLIRHNGHLIGGMFDTNALGKKENISQWVTMISVADIEAAVDRVTTEGGKILTAPKQLKTRGILSIVEDPTGAIVALIQTKDGDPADREPEHNDFLWDELWTSDVERAGNFYSQVAGYRREDRAPGDGKVNYHLLVSAEKPRAGILQNPFGDVPPVWVNYLRVEDPSAITARVEALGGTILLDTQTRNIGAETAFIADPSGAGIALQTWPLKQDKD